MWFMGNTNDDETDKDIIIEQLKQKILEQSKEIDSFYKSVMQMENRKIREDSKVFKLNIFYEDVKNNGVLYDGN